MAHPRVTRAGELAAQLTSAGITATHDVRKVTGTPTVLIGPPRLAFDGYAGPTATWRLLAIAGTTEQFAAWQQIDDLIDKLYDLDWLYLESGEPSQFAKDAGSEPRPAYALTFTETVE